MEQSLSLLPSHLCVGIAENETNGGEEVGLSGTIATDNDIKAGREGFDDGLVLVGLEALDDYLLDMHCEALAHGE